MLLSNVLKSCAQVTRPRGFAEKLCTLMEPSPSLRVAIADILAPLGLRVASFDAPGPFRDAFRALDPSLIMMDETFLQSSRLDPASLKSGRSHGSDPVLLLTVNADGPNSIVRGLCSGADECIVKPFDRDVLQSKLRCLGVV